MNNVPVLKYDNWDHADWVNGFISDMPNLPINNYLQSVVSRYFFVKYYGNQ
jgi:hypothetical protein